MRFMRYKWLYFFISGLVIIPGLFSLFFWGLKPSIDFTGGSLLEIKISNIKLKNPIEEIKKIFKKNKVDIFLIQTAGKNIFIIRSKPIDKNKKEKILNDIIKKFGKTEEIRFETIGPILGKELINKTILGLLIASGFIFFYVGSRFKEKIFGTCAILAMFHDTLVLLGTFSLLGHFCNVEIDTLFVTALLTVLSFSIHDTVVIYDRLRENQRQNPNIDLEHLADKTITETLTRSLNNSLTIIFMLLALWLLGGETIKWFVFALLIGTVSGTYSSTFTAVPLLVVWDKIKRKKKFIFIFGELLFCCFYCGFFNSLILFNRYSLLFFLGSSIISSNSKFNTCPTRGPDGIFNIFITS